MNNNKFLYKIDGCTRLHQMIWKCNNAKYVYSSSRKTIFPFPMNDFMKMILDTFINEIIIGMNEWTLDGWLGG